MKDIIYRTSGTCSRAIHVVIDDEGRITTCEFAGGCNGNLKGIGALVVGQRAEDVIGRVRGIQCNGRPTSCPDQLALALQEALSAADA